MTGLRNRQKTDRTNRIITAATNLFRVHGYEAVKMDAIAEKAELSIGTIYNYYQNKGDLLLAIVVTEVNMVLKQGAELVDNPPLHVGDAVDKLSEIYIDNALVYLNKEVWRLAMSISIQQPLSPLGITYVDLDNALMAQTCALFAKLQALGLVHAHIDTVAVGELHFNNANNMFINYVKNDTMKVLEMRNMIRRQCKLVIEAVSV
jgi:AcrR family transcriptional regulator